MAEPNEEKLSEDQLLNLIEQNGGPRGLDLRDKDLSGLHLNREDILRKLKERGYTSLEPAQFLQRWWEVDDWEVMREKGYVQGDYPPWLSTDTLGLNLFMANLQRADLFIANLQHADLFMADLQHADLFMADLQHAILGGAKLQHADLFMAKLQHAILSVAKLQHAILSVAKLQHSLLSVADLQHAHLIKADLQHARLRMARLQHALLAGVAGLEEARLEGVDWGESYKLGDEDAKDYERAEEVYRRLKQWYSSHGNYHYAGEFHLREMECRRKEVQGKLRGWQEIRKEWWELVTLWFFNFSCGYGERPRRVLVWLGLFLLVPGLLYWLFSPLSVGNALYYSFASLVAFINPLEVEISPWLGTAALGQAYVGYFLLALFLVVLVLKMGHR